MKYKDKLKDPRWQKKRLEILERDNWACQICGDEESTLVVHHFKYSNCEPWDIDNEYLITYCEDCHKSEHEDRKVFKKLLDDTMIKLQSDTYRSLSCIVYKILQQSSIPPYEAINVLENLLTYEDNFFNENILDYYFDKLKNKKLEE